MSEVVLGIGPPSSDLDTNRSHRDHVKRRTSILRSEGSGSAWPTPDLVMRVHHIRWCRGTRVILKSELCGAGSGQLLGDTPPDFGPTAETPS